MPTVVLMSVGDHYSFDCLHEGVFVRIADAPDRGGNAVEGEFLGVSHCGVLRPGIRMCPQLFRLDRVSLPIAFPETHPQRYRHELDVFGGLRMPGDNAL